jgi:hypothetical protein
MDNTLFFAAFGIAFADFEVDADVKAPAQEGEQTSN